jgi:hypothetical protein
MKTILTILIGTISLGAALPALAGPDWQAIEQARKNHRAQVGRMEKLTPDEKCAAKRLVLPLDHGPRAQSTPYLNEQRKASFEAELKACKESAAKGNVQ